MGTIQFEKANCKHCYKCVRKCSVKAIAFKDDQAKILEEECILCGQCFLVCPQNAKFIQSDVSVIKNYRASGKKIYASIAPSYVAALDGLSFSSLSAALKKIGFAGVEETATGAGMVTAEYEQILLKGEMKNMITTCCPTVNLLIEKYYPELAPYAAPVVSPAVAHGKALKRVYGEDIKVVFIGPCISKKHEASHIRDIDAVLIFDELIDWFEEERVNFDMVDYQAVETYNVKNRLYPIPGGILETMSLESKKNYKCIAVDGIDRCMEMMDVLKMEEEGRPLVEGYCIEMSACTGSCVYGPALRNFHKPFLLSRENVLKSADKKSPCLLPATETVSENLNFKFGYSPRREVQPLKEDLTGIFQSMGKFEEEDMYNCGACGYETCMDKAIAIWNGKAEIKMCMPFMWGKMISYSNLVLANIPDAVIMVDKNFDIMEYNQSAITMLQLKEYSRVGLPLDMLFEISHFKDEAILGNNVYDEVQYVEEIDKTLEITSIKADMVNNHIIFVKDITGAMKKKEQYMFMRENALKTAQQVIDKQMRVAQEIASLLGETTGETKVALTKLKRTISESQEIEESIIHCKR